jgi:hypothetical protein
MGGLHFHDVFEVQSLVVVHRHCCTLARLSFKALLSCSMPKSGNHKQNDDKDNPSKGVMLQALLHSFLRKFSPTQHPRLTPLLMLSHAYYQEGSNCGNYAEFDRKLI